MEPITTARQALGYARLAGFSYLMIFILAIFANFSAVGGVFVADDPGATLTNLQASTGVFRLGIAAFVLVLFFDVLISWALFVLLQPVDARLSLLSALMRLFYTAVFAVVLFDLVDALAMVSTDGPPSATLIYERLEAFQTGFTISLIYFGLHLVLLGGLIIRAPFLPSLIGIGLIIAGVAYTLDGFGAILVSDYGPYGGIAAMLVIVPALIAEGAACLWLLIRGIDPRRWDAMRAAQETSGAA